MPEEENNILSTSLLQNLLQLVSRQIVADNTTLRTSLLLQWIITLTVPEVLVSVTVQILSVSVWRAVGKFVRDVLQPMSQYCGGDVK